MAYWTPITAILDSMDLKVDHGIIGEKTFLLVNRSMIKRVNNNISIVGAFINSLDTCPNAPNYCILVSSESSYDLLFYQFET